mgnify:CR=1 FL=1
MFRKNKKTLESELSKIINLETNFGQWLLNKLTELKFDPKSLSIYSLDIELQKGAVSDGTKIFAWEKDWRISTNGDRKDVYDFMCSWFNSRAVILGPEYVYLDQDHTGIYV